jgi:hypothetical protein
LPSHRPYSKDPNSPPSVTQILGLLDKPGLSWGAARETAKFAVHHQPAWMDKPSDEATTILYRHHRGVWDHRALLGTALHTINAEWCAGNTVRVADVVAELRSRSPLWRRRNEQEIYAEILPMADGLSRWWMENQPETQSFETVVRYPVPGLEYIGQTDWRAGLDGLTWLLDLKTTGNTKPGSAKYWDTWRLQLAAYRYATEAVVYDDDDQERGTIELPPVDRTGILHLYGNGDCRLEPVRAEAKEHQVFLQLRQVYGWVKGQGQRPGIPIGVPA